MKYVNNAVMWTRKDKNGKTYFGFKAERDIKSGETFNIFQNDKGGVETRPDYRSYEKVEDDYINKEQSGEHVGRDLAEEVANDLPF